MESGKEMSVESGVENCVDWNVETGKWSGMESGVSSSCVLRIVCGMCNYQEFMFCVFVWVRGSYQV